MRSYGQYCGLARSLEVVGDRWNLLIVRQLLVAHALAATQVPAVDEHRGGVLRERDERPRFPEDR